MATSRNCTFKAKIREELICAVCLDFLQEPKVLLCAHSFCKVCLERIISTNSRLGNDHKKNELECPSCRHVTHLASGKAAELKTNFNLKRLVDIVSEEDKKAARDALQRRRTVRPSIRATRSLCKQHHRQFEYFCLDCSELLCPRCITANHREHQFQDVDQVLPKQIEQLRSLIQPAYEVASQAESLMNELFEDKNKVSNNSNEVADSVKAYFGKIQEMLEQRQKAMLSTIHKYSDVKLTRLDIHYRTLEQHRATILDGISKIEQMIENEDNVGLLSQKQSLSEELEEHQQSIISLSESLTESREFAAQLLFREDAITTSLGDLGTLNECRKEPNSLFMSLRRVIVTEDEDPYLDVPLRFEDMEGGEHMRIDESKERVEYEPQSKPSHDKINQSKQVVNDIVCSEDQASTYDVPKPLQPPPVKPRIPKRRSSMEKDKPVPPPKSHSTQDYDVPRRPPKPAHLEQKSPQHKVRKSVTLPHNAAGGIRPSRFFDNFQEEGPDSDPDDYEPLPELPTPSPRTIPPPLPPNHPSQQETKPRPVPRPRRQMSGPSFPPLPPKPRSKTLPPGSVTSPVTRPLGQANILNPVLVIDNKDLSWPYSHETVYPSGVCCCTELHDTLIITDVFNHCVRLIDYKGKFIEKVGREGRSGGQFKEPSAVTVDKTGHIYVTERDNPRVQKFTSTGKYITKFGQKTLRGTLLSDPVAIAVSPKGQIVVSDWEKSQIFFFSSNGKVANIIGKENGGFIKLPAGIVFNKEGHLFVADRGSHCVWELTSDGDLVTKFGTLGSHPGQLNFPYGITISERNNIIVSESGNSRISVFSSKGDFMCCFGEPGEEPGKFNHPRHLCLNSRNQLVVSDEMNQRVQLFDLPFDC